MTAGHVFLALSSYRLDGRSIREGNPVERMPGPYADAHTRQSGGASAGPRGDVPTRLTLRATPGELTCCKPKGTVARWTEPGRRERVCPELFTILGNW
jgi:hypothetical protein